MLKIRKETPADYSLVETITRRAFYNLYVPGCTEHYLLHNMRRHPDFIPELALVLELNGRIIGSIIYTKARLLDAESNQKDILTFGPVCIDPSYQRRGYGKKLLAYSFHQAKLLGYDVIVIFGNPANYVSSGFKSCKKANICLENGKYPAAMLVKELRPNALDGRQWHYCESPVMAINEADARQYDDTLPPLTRRQQPSQEEFYIISRSFVE